MVWTYTKKGFVKTGSSGGATRNPADVRAGIDASKLAQTSEAQRTATEEEISQYKQTGVGTTQQREQLTKYTTSQPLSGVYSKKQQQQIPPVSTRTPLNYEERLFVSEYRAAPRDQGFIERLRKKSLQLEYSGKLERKPLKRQALMFSAFGTAAISSPLTIIRHPIKTIKGIGTMIRHPIQTTKEIGTGLIERPATTAGEIVGTAVAFGAIGKGAKSIAKPIKSKLLKTEVEGLVSQKGKVITIGKKTDLKTIGEFKGKGTTYYEILGKRIKPKTIKDVTSEVQYIGTKKKADIGIKADIGKKSTFTGKGRGIFSGETGIETFELIGKTEGVKDLSYVKGVRGYKITLGKQEPLIIGEKVGKVFKEKVSSTVPYRIESIAKTTKPKSVSINKGTTYDKIIGSVPEEVGFQLKKRGEISTVSDVGIAGVKVERPITFKTIEKGVEYVPVTSKKISVPKKFKIERDVYIPESKIETFSKVGVGFTEKITKPSRAKLIEDIFPKFIPRRVKLPSGQYLGVGLDVPTTITIKPKLKPSTIYKFGSGASAKQFARIALKQARLTEKSTSTTFGFIIPEKEKTFPISKIIISPVSKPISKSTIKPIKKDIISPISKPTMKPISKPITKPIMKPISKPTMKPILKPITKPQLKPIIKPTLKQKLKPILKPKPLSPIVPLVPPVKTFFKFERIDRIRKRKILSKPIKQSKPTYKPSLFGMELYKTKGKSIGKAPKITGGIGIRLVVKPKKKKGKKKKNKGVFEI